MPSVRADKAHIVAVFSQKVTATMPDRDYDIQLTGEFYDGDSRLCPTGGAFCRDTGVAWAYMSADIAGAGPQRLRMLLYDGAIRLSRQAMAALDDGDVELAADRLARARASIRRLRDSLHADEGRSDRQRFVELYRQVHHRLIEADFYRRREGINETISLLNCGRAAWSEFAQAHCRQTLSSPAEASSKSWVG